MLGRVINWLLPAGRWAKLRRIGQLIGAACLLLIAIGILLGRGQAGVSPRTAA